MVTEYEAALAKANEASRKFSAIQKAYRAREIGDAEFLAGKAEWNASTKAFDIARNEVAAS